MTPCLVIHRAALRFPMKHGLGVYPLEGYGFLFGEGEGYCRQVSASIPVGKTAEWYNNSDRFARLAEAYDTAQRLAAAHALRIIGVYHSYSGGHPDWPGSERAPVLDIPQRWESLLLLVPLVEGGERWGYRLCVHDPRWGWREADYRTVTEPIADSKLNPRRLLQGWQQSWDYLTLAYRGPC